MIYLDRFLKLPGMLIFDTFTEAVAQRPWACNFIKKEALARCFPESFAKFLRTPFLIEHFQWLLLHLLSSEDPTSFHFSKIATLTAQKMKFSIKDLFSKCDHIY